MNYFRFQEEEYAILQMLDGQISLDEIKERFEAEFRALVAHERKRYPALSTDVDAELVRYQVAFGCARRAARAEAASRLRGSAAFL